MASKVMQVRLSDEDFEWLDDQARRRGMNRSELIRLLVSRGRAGTQQAAQSGP
jgi:hypothetical protein